MISPDPMYSSKGNKDGHNSPTWAGDETTPFYDQALEDDHLAEEFNHTTNANHLEFCKHMPLVFFSIPSNQIVLEVTEIDDTKDQMVSRKRKTYNDGDESGSKVVLS